MKPRFPLYARILLWFFLNLGLIIAAAWLVVDVQVRSGFDSFLAGYVGQRVEPVARRFTEELAAVPEAEWNAVAERFSRENNVQFLVMAGPQRLAGPDLELPEVVRQRVPRGGPGGRPPGGERPPRQPMTDGGEPRGPGPEGDGARKDGLEPRSLPIHERFFLRSDNPRAYWSGLLMAMRRAEGFGPPRPVTLLLRSESFGAGGLFFDFTPWLLGAAGLALLSVLWWLPLVRNLTGAIARLNAATARVAEGRFDAQADEKRTDELGQLGGSINRMAERLEGYVKGQKRFLGDVAHELCSPLARIQMALGILEQRADDKQKPYLEDVREEVQHMSNLINELLSFSKAALKPMEVKLAPVNVKAVAEAAMQREAADGGEVKLEVPDDLHVLANAELLQRALANLLRNALRYAGHAGPVEISARREGDSVRLSVADRGPGIPKEHVEKIFETFYRIEADRGRDTGGVGLGLAIVRQCVEACGGTVRARNRPRGGLRVILQLRHAAVSSTETIPEPCA